MSSETHIRCQVKPILALSKLTRKLANRSTYVLNNSLCVIWPEQGGSPGALSLWNFSLVLKMVITFRNLWWLAKLIHPKLRLDKQKGFHKREDQTRRNVFVLIETNMASSNEHKELSKANIVALWQVYILLGKNPLRPEQPFLLNVLICHWIHFTNPTVEDWTLLWINQKERKRSLSNFDLRSQQIPKWIRLPG